jgi:hypothetical protein
VASGFSRMRIESVAIAVGTLVAVLWLAALIFGPFLAAVLLR